MLLHVKILGELSATLIRHTIELVRDHYNMLDLPRDTFKANNSSSALEHIFNIATNGLPQRILHGDARWDEDS